MAVIRPFRAVRPEAAARRRSVGAYDVVSTGEARQLAAGNPLSFLHVTRSEIDLPAGTDPYSPEVYAKAASNFAALQRAAPLVTEAEPSLYLYRLRMGSHEQTGVAGCFSVDEYERDIIRKHERTRRDKEDDRTRHIIDLRAQTGLVFLTYKASTAVTAIARSLTAGAPLFDFAASDGTQHTIWKAGAKESAELLDVFSRIPALYIADGHHRAASAARARAELRERGEVGEADTFIAVAFPDDQVQILAYNRTVKELGGNTPEGFLAALRERKIPVQEGRSQPAAKRHVSMYFAGRWYTWTCRKFSPPTGSRARRSTWRPAAQCSRAAARDRRRSDGQADRLRRRRPRESALEAAVDQGRAAVAFAMHPVTIDDLMSISDEGGIMPPKSTWFEPKLRDGLLIHVF